MLRISQPAYLNFTEKAHISPFASYQPVNLNIDGASFIIVEPLDYLSLLITEQMKDNYTIITDCDAMHVFTVNA